MVKFIILLAWGLNVLPSIHVAGQPVATQQGNWQVLRGGSLQPIDTIFLGTGRETVIVTVCIDGVPAGSTMA